MCTNKTSNYHQKEKKRIESNIQDLFIIFKSNQNMILSCLTTQPQRFSIKINAHSDRKTISLNPIQMKLKFSLLIIINHICMHFCDDQKKVWELTTHYGKFRWQYRARLSGACTSFFCPNYHFISFLPVFVNISNNHFVQNIEYP